MNCAYWYCLHKTHLSQNAKPRISIDMRVDISGNKIYNNKSVKEDERLVLYNRKQWQKINYRNIKYHCKSAKEIENFMAKTNLYKTEEHIYAQKK